MAPNDGALDLLTEGEALCLLRSWGLTADGARQVLRKHGRWYAGGNGRSDCYTAAEIERIGAPYRAAEDLRAQTDPEYQARIEAQRVTLEFGSKSVKRLDGGQRSIEDSPLFGGERQGGLF